VKIRIAVSIGLFDISAFCDLKPYDLRFELDPAVIDNYPSLNIARRSLSIGMEEIRITFLFCYYTTLSIREKIRFHVDIRDRTKKNSFSFACITAERKK